MPPRWKANSATFICTLLWIIEIVIAISRISLFLRSKKSTSCEFLFCFIQHHLSPNRLVLFSLFFFSLHSTVCLLYSKPKRSWKIAWNYAHIHTHTHPPLPLVYYKYVMLNIWNLKTTLLKSMLNKEGREEKWKMENRISDGMHRHRHRHKQKQTNDKWESPIPTLNILHFHTVRWMSNVFPLFLFPCKLLKWTVHGTLTFQYTSICNHVHAFSALYHKHIRVRFNIHSYPLNDNFIATRYKKISFVLSLSILRFRVHLPKMKKRANKRVLWVKMKTDMEKKSQQLNNCKDFGWTKIIVH